jgi:hypothetical protein
MLKAENLKVVPAGQATKKITPFQKAKKIKDLLIAGITEAGLNPDPLTFTVGSKHVGLVVWHGHKKVCAVNLESPSPASIHKVLGYLKSLESITQTDTPDIDCLDYSDKTPVDPVSLFGSTDYGCPAKGVSEGSVYAYLAGCDNVVITVRHTLNKLSFQVYLKEDHPMKPSDLHKALAPFGFSIKSDTRLSAHINVPDEQTSVIALMGAVLAVVSSRIPAIRHPKNLSAYLWVGA